MNVRQIQWLTLSAIIGVGLNSMPRTLSAEPEPAVNIDTIATKWAAREAGAPKLHCEWRGDVLIPAGSERIMGAHKVHKPFPAEDELVSRHYSLWLDGPKMRFETRGKQIVTTTETIEDRQNISVNNGMESRTLFSGDKTTHLRYGPVGFIHNETPWLQMASINLRPVLLLYRPSLPAVKGAVNISDFSLLPGHHERAGRTCLLLEQIDSQRRRQLWVDKEASFAPIALVEVVRDTPTAEWKPTYQIEWSYDFARSQTAEPMVTGWKYIMYNSKRIGQLLNQASLTVVACDAPATVDESLFTLSFPVGTTVSDVKSDEYYILREGGRKRFITMAEQEAGLPYKSLVTTEPPVPMEQRRWSLTHLFVSMTVILAAVILLVTFVIKWGKSK